MKKILLSALLFCGIAANAQVKYGVKAGVNFANANIKYSGISISPGSQTSFHLTGFADLSISDKFSIQPGLSLQGKGYKFDLSEDGETLKAKQNIGYIEIPVNGVFYLPAGQGNIFLGAGPYVAYGIFGKQKAEGTSIDDMEEDINFGNSEDDDVSPFDFGLNFMLGYRFDSGFLFNGGYGLGLGNFVPKDQRTGDSKGTNKVFSISVGYSF